MTEEDVANAIADAVADARGILRVGPEVLENVRGGYYFDVASRSGQQFVVEVRRA